MAISSCSDRMAKEKSVIPIERIAAQIYVIRGESVMLDADLAELYHVETGTLVRAMKRNLDRFPEDFAFQLALLHESLRHVRLSPMGQGASDLLVR